MLTNAAARARVWSGGLAAVLRAASLELLNSSAEEPHWCFQGRARGGRSRGRMWAQQRSTDDEGSPRRRLSVRLSPRKPASQKPEAGETGGKVRGYPAPGEGNVFVGRMLTRVCGVILLFQGTLTLAWTKAT